MEGYEQHQFFRQPQDVREARRYDYPLVMCQLVAQDTARRVEESRKWFKWNFFRGDCHSHTQHSDGIGTVAETAAMRQLAELDFQFVTDHWGVTQGPECEEHGLWVGQEPVTQHHHLGILGLDHAFTPQIDLLKDVAEVSRLGGTPFIPHPAGWWDVTRYSEEQKRALQDLPSPFLMEICNGANNIINAFDYTDDDALQVWDELLDTGRVVHALGNTDAHAPHAIGIVWNSVFAPRCDQSSIIKALRAGRSFVSDAPLVHIAMGKAKMGGRAGKEDRRRPLRITAVDSRGLSSVRVVADRKRIASWNVDARPQLIKSLTLPRSARRYVRVEVRSMDGRRAFSNPIYLA